eukprot:TRINITY_DN41803_c0_g1_i1.p1 TRINITY_DN41803_c0_g1~~TRINITY_DN41803_c0_g1_i1.p1  ORF type:complete len:123 (-),score=45.50 TRINITY_DN41803_c0_g1_i1:83-451(-)
MGDCEAVVGLDGHKDGMEGGEKHKQTRLSTSQSSISLSSGQSRTSRGTAQIEVKLPWYMGVTCKDVKDILPTLLILLVGLLIMVLVIPYAFSSVFKQLEMEKEISRIREEMNKNKTLAKTVS